MKTILIFLLVIFSVSAGEPYSKIVNGKQVLLTAQEISDIKAIRAVAKTKRDIDNAKTQEDKIDETIQRDAILKVLFDLVIANSTKTKAEVLTMIKVEQNK